jgi:hypothetical protein
MPPSLQIGETAITLACDRISKRTGTVEMRKNMALSVRGSNVGRRGVQGFKPPRKAYYIDAVNSVNRRPQVTMTFSTYLTLKHTTYNATRSRVMMTKLHS